jgi:hypothetical protein
MLDKARTGMDMRNSPWVHLAQLLRLHQRWHNVLLPAYIMLAIHDGM